MKLRPYQQDAFSAVVEHIKTCLEPCLVEAATGAGKSHIVAAIAHWVKDASDKKVLCLAPSKELTEQNHAKYLATGNPASIYSASIVKSMAHDVVFGTPKTVLNSIDKFGSNYAAIVVDEAHGITPTIKSIISKMRAKNPNIRVIGLTATPYRTGEGYIYQYGADGKPVPDGTTINPYFHRLLYRITARELIDMGYLTPPYAMPVSDSYDTSTMVRFTNAESEQVFEGKGRKTAAIVADIVANSLGRKGVMIFSATIQHANEIMESLDPKNARIVTGSTPKIERENIISDFKARRFKYIVNVAVLTTGFDAPHVDVVAILRATESAGLLQQIAGRGCRLFDNKTDFLLLDYAQNIERHCPSGDIFDPNISVTRKSETFYIDAECPDCKTKNEFAGRPNPEGFNIDKNGYFVDLRGKRVFVDEQPMPAHFGRRCFGESIIKGYSNRCDYRWSFKSCESCNHENDIAARYCSECKGELVDPNDKLVLEFTRMKHSPSIPTFDKVITWRVQEWISQSGNETLRIDFTTDIRTFPVWFIPKHNDWLELCHACNVEAWTPQEFINSNPEMPFSVKAEKKGNFFKILKYNGDIDEISEVA